MSGPAEWVSAVATLAGSAAVMVGLWYADHQLTLAREAQQANVIYNAQKDYHDLFVKT
jgi:hypothetical protein